MLWRPLQNIRGEALTFNAVLRRRRSAFIFCFSDASVINDLPCLPGVHSFDPTALQHRDRSAETDLPPRFHDRDNIYTSRSENGFLPSSVGCGPSSGSCGRCEHRIYVYTSRCRRWPVVQVSNMHKDGSRAWTNSFKHHMGRWRRYRRHAHSSSRQSTGFEHC